MFYIFHSLMRYFQRFNFLLLLLAVCGNTQAANPQGVSARAFKQTFTQSEILERLQVLCDAAKEGERKPNDADLRQVRTQIRAAVDKLRARLARQPAGRETLQLEPLRQSLLRTSDFQPDAITETYQILASPNEFDAEIVGPLFRLLRKYLTLELAVKNEDFSEEYRTFCGGIPAFVETFLSGEYPEYGPALTDAVVWLSDLDECAPLAGRIAAFLNETFGHSNLFVQVSSDFLSHAFQRTIEEPLLVNDRVLDTRVHGSGQVSGQTSIEFCPNEDRAQIKLLLTTQMSTNTVGRNGPIRVSSTGDGSVWGEKTVFLADDLFRTTPARSSTDLAIRTTGIGVEGRCLTPGIVLKIAQNQLPKRKPRYDAESRRIAVSRLNSRLNSEVDQQINQLFARYRKEFREPLLETGLFPTPWKFQTTATELKWSALVAASFQQGAASNPPELPDHSDIAVRVHQTALNNAAQSQWAGRRIEIDEFLSQLQEKYPKLAEQIHRDEEDPLTAITFAEKSPVSLTFKKNLVTIVVHIDRFEQDEQEHPGLDITIKYRVKVEKTGENGMETRNFVFEKAEAPTVFPPGFDPNGGARMGARYFAIRNIVMKRLDQELQDTFVVSPVELEEQWKDKGRLIPQTIAADQGWLAVSFLFQ